MNALSIKILGITGFLIIALWCILDSKDRIPAEISQMVADTLQAEQLSLDSIRVSGRDVFLNGTLPDSTSLKRVVRVIGSIAGVRHMEYELRVVPPMPKSPAIQQSLNDLLAKQRILFQARSDRILAKSDSVLEQIIDILQQYTGSRIEIRGHTDSTGSAAFNLTLSQHRAEAVRTYLISKGIAPGRLIARGYGSSKPVASNATPEGRKKNRRVEFIVLEGQ